MKSGVIIRSAGYKTTQLSCLNTSGCVRFQGSTAGNFVAIGAGVAKGTTTLTVADSAGFVVGGGAQIQQQDYDPPSASWGADAVGQMLIIIAIGQNILAISPPLHIDYDMGHQPQIRPVNYIENAGLEDLHLKQMDSDAELCLCR